MHEKAHAAARAETQRQPKRHHNCHAGTECAALEPRNSTSSAPPSHNTRQTRLPHRGAPADAGSRCRHHCRAPVPALLMAAGARLHLCPRLVRTRVHRLVVRQLRSTRHVEQETQHAWECESTGGGGQCASVRPFTPTVTPPPHTHTHNQPQTHTLPSATSCAAAALRSDMREGRRLK